MSHKSRVHYTIPICLEGCTCQSCKRSKKEAEEIEKLKEQPNIQPNTEENGD